MFYYLQYYLNHHRVNMLFIYAICFVFRTVSTTYVNGEQEDWSSKIAQPSVPQSQPYYQPQQSSVGQCPSNSQCVPLAACPTLSNILDHTCLNTNRVGSLGCGYVGSGLICCPQGFTYTASSYAPKFPTTASGIAGSREDRKCGKPVVQGENYHGIGEHPWVVRIGFRNQMTGEVKYPCAGSILNKRVVLTAAHCALAKADNYKLYSVRVGEFRTDSTLDCGEEFCALPLQDIALSHVIVHPGYEQQTFKNDIALMILRADINFTVTAQPICILDSWSQPSNQAVLVGWGRSAGQSIQPPFQQTIDLPVIGLQQCINVYSRTIPISDDHLCAGGQYGKDACEGFGGAPLIVKHSNVYYQIGVLSFGSNQCGAAGVPSVYTSVKKYSQWIKENTPLIYS